MNLPNKITMLRILTVPILVAFLSFDWRFKHLIAAVIFVVISLTDVLDGFIARKTNQVTDFGKFIDPLADKILMSAVLLYIITIDKDYLWMSFIIIFREFAVTGLRVIAAKKKKVISASWIGKTKAWVQSIAIVYILLSTSDTNFLSSTELPYAYYVMMAAVLITIISGLDYFMKGRKLLKDM